MAAGGTGVFNRTFVDAIGQALDRAERYVFWFDQANASTAQRPMECP
jgi:hypothetical protein